MEVLQLYYYFFFLCTREGPSVLCRSLVASFIVELNIASLRWAGGRDEVGKVGDCGCEVEKW